MVCVNDSFTKQATNVKTGHFRSFRNIAEKRLLAMSVRRSVRMEQLGYQWTEIHENLYLIIFRKSVGEKSSSIKI